MKGTYVSKVAALAILTTSVNVAMISEELHQFRGQEKSTGRSILSAQLSFASLM
jgi:hypothetical protein